MIRVACTPVARPKRSAPQQGALPMRGGDQFAAFDDVRVAGMPFEPGVIRAS